MSPSFPVCRPSAGQPLYYSTSRAAALPENAFFLITNDPAAFFPLLPWRQVVYTKMNKRPVKRQVLQKIKLYFILFLFFIVDNSGDKMWIISHPDCG